SRGMGFDRMIPVSDYDKENISQGVPLDREGLYLSLDLAGFNETVLLLADDDGIVSDDIPGLLQGEALVLHPLPEGRRPNLSRALLSLPTLQACKKQLVALFNALHHILHCLGAKLLPVEVAWHLLQQGDTLHQPVLVQVFSKPAMVPLMHGNTMVPDLCGNINLVMQFPVPLRSVCLESEGSQWFF